MSSVVGVWRFAAFACVASAFAFASACGESNRTSEGDGNGTGGMAGAAPSGGDGNTSGGSPAGGSGGSGGSSGSASGGTSGSSAGGAESGGTTSGGSTNGGIGGSGTGGGGDAGDGGSSGGGQPECLSAEDCRMVSDCCGCRAEPIDEPTFCALPCVRDACGEIAIDTDEVACVQGRCVIARNCNGQTGCAALPPECADGTVPSVLGDCWGPCLPPTDCQSVRSCEVCGDDFCVEFQAQQSTFSCVTRVDECDLENYCQCLGVCGECSEADDQVQCPCLGC